MLILCRAEEYGYPSEWWIVPSERVCIKSIPRFENIYADKTFHLFIQPEDFITGMLGKCLLI